MVFTYALVLLANAIGGAATETTHSAVLERLAGGWRLDRSASRLKGPLTIIGSAPGGYSFAFGGARFVLKEDGRFYPTIVGRETSLARVGDRRWTRVHRINGQDVDRSTLTLSADRRALKISTSTVGRAPQVEVLRRSGPGRNLAGAWRSLKTDANISSTLSFSLASEGSVRWGALEDGNYYVVRPDGPPAVNTGPTATPAASLQVHWRGGALDWTEAVNAKPYRIGETRLSPDGSYLTETSWYAATPGEREIAVYRRANGAGS